MTSTVVIYKVLEERGGGKTDKRMSDGSIWSKCQEMGVAAETFTSWKEEIFILNILASCRLGEHLDGHVYAGVGILNKDYVKMILGRRYNANSYFPPTSSYARFLCI